MYERDSDGTWRYAVTGIAVPGARDITIADRVPAKRVGGGVWLSRPLALVEPKLRDLLQDLGTLSSFMLSEPVDGLPPNTPSVILVSSQFWDEHAGDVIDVDAPELHAGAVLVIEEVARMVSLTPESLMEYVRRGTFPQPPVRLGRTPAWPRPVVQQWLAGRRPTRVPCAGCGAETEIFGLVAKKSSGDQYTVPLCPACGRRITTLLPTQPHPWTFEIVQRLLRAQDPEPVQNSGGR